MKVVFYYLEYRNICVGDNYDMLKNKAKRVQRSPEEFALAVDDKLAKTDRTIEESEKKKQETIQKYKKTKWQKKDQKLKRKKMAILTPKKRRKTKTQKMKELFVQAKKSGMNSENYETPGD